MMRTANSRHRKLSYSSLRIAYIGDSTGAGFGANGAANWDSGSPYFINTNSFPSAAQQENTAIPSAVRLLRTYLEARGTESTVHNYSVAGRTAADHVSAGTVAALTERYDFALVELGINSAKQNLTHEAELTTLIGQLKARRIQPVLVKSHNIGVAYTANGIWVENSLPSEWVPMDNWPTYRLVVSSVAAREGIDVVDLGTPDCLLDTSLLHDSFHPSEAGYVAKFTKLKTWIDGLR